MSQPTWLEITRGELPLVLSFPHTGTGIPDEVLPGIKDKELALRDTDWWVEQLYGFAAGMGATMVRSGISRTVIDLNRDPSGASLYPGQATTGLCPIETFDGLPLYKPGQEPDEIEIERRLKTYYQPYHDALAAEIERLRKKFGKVVLYDCHSIRSVVPRLFEGELPVFNIGTNSGASCDPALTAVVENACDASRFNRTTNGRFKGGWITRHYGQPATGVHAVQMELSHRGYMDEIESSTPKPFDPARAAEMQSALTRIFSDILAWI
ncbi:N-formylglutamate deformylase [Lacibacterium aquatile]|uniref:N-formylglutamate deformylase n=1 Tax=Lacibacterium aquatile TaxID=1168082 RepID=A0ABW5DX70_9PROT